ncbi:MAG TPA: DUF935 family protein, partial [Polyangiaceae bacterium]|nr:DUF935 family protein [Polyangiaceae bacterium]
SQIVWDVGGKRWKPYLKTFASRYSWYHWELRCHVAVTLDGQFPITGGDGHWVMYAPYGEYRGWMRGAMWALAQWWLARMYALRDWARYSERHGFPIIIADTPFGADPDDVASYQSQLATLGQESILQLPGSAELGQFGKYDLRYLEPRDRSWEGFQQLIEQCNTEITLALLGQNLTSQVKEGSLAAARVHADVRQAILEADARAISKVLHTQVLRPWAALNYGDARLAPRVEWDVRPQEDLVQKADTFSKFASAIQQLRQAGFALKSPEKFAKRFGLVGLDLVPVPPVQIEAQLARATGQDKGEVAAEKEEGGNGAPAAGAGGPIVQKGALQGATPAAPAQKQAPAQQPPAKPVAKQPAKKDAKQDDEHPDVGGALDKKRDEAKGHADKASDDAQDHHDAGAKKADDHADKGTGKADDASDDADDARDEGKDKADKLSKAADKLKDAADKISQTATDLGDPESKLTFAQRHAAFLADVRELEAGGFEVNLADLARRHGVPVPKRKKT